MRVIITGASGLLGREVFKALNKCGTYDVTGTCFRRSDNKDLLSLDITNEKQLTQLISDKKPDAIIHCAAERRPDVVEKDSSMAEALNVTATQAICDLAKKSNCWLVYISTNYVFDGKNAPYQVEDAPNPLNTYGKMKLAGEHAVLSSNPDNAVLRVPILYGPVEYLSESAVTVLYEKVKDTSTDCFMAHRQRRFPTHTENVADIITQLVDRHKDKPFSVKGIYHFSEPVQMSKYDMAVKMAEAMKLSNTHIKADTSEPTSTAAPRPYDCQMDTSKLISEGFKIKCTDFKKAIQSILS